MSIKDSQTLKLVLTGSQGEEPRSPTPASGSAAGGPRLICSEPRAPRTAPQCWAVPGAKHGLTWSMGVDGRERCSRCPAAVKRQLPFSAGMNKRQRFAQLTIAAGGQVARRRTTPPAVPHASDSLRLSSADDASCGVLSDDGFLSSWPAWRRPRPLRPQSEMRGSLCCPRALPRAPALSPPPAQKDRGGAHHLPALRAPSSAPRPCRWVGVVLAVSRPGPSAATAASVVFP